MNIQPNHGEPNGTIQKIWKALVVIYYFMAVSSIVGLVQEQLEMEKWRTRGDAGAFLFAGGVDVFIGFLGFAIVVGLHQFIYKKVAFRFIYGRAWNKNIDEPEENDVY